MNTEARLIRTSVFINQLRICFYKFQGDRSQAMNLREGEADASRARQCEARIASITSLGSVALLLQAVTKPHMRGVTDV